MIFAFLTVFGEEAEMPFGSPRKDGSFFEPGLITKVEKQIKKRKLKGWSRLILIPGG